MPSSTNFAVEVNSLTKRFGTFEAVKGISFNVPKGKIVGFLGPNGAGKTTTIQMLLGLLIPSSGTISYFGKDLATHRQEIMEKVNFSSTYISMPWRLTIKECLTYTSFLYKINNRRKRVEEVIETFRLQDLQHKEVAQLSEGQRTRLMLAKGFVNHPEVLLLDEPTASMDPESAQYIRDFIQSYRKEHDISILFTSHNMPEVEDICDDVIFINGGEVIAHDTPENLARKLDIARVSLTVADGLKRVAAICEKDKLPYTVNGRYIKIDLKEKAIPDFLKKLLEKGIDYTEISIDKPNLEDFFLAVTGKNNHGTA
ncbi:MAG: Daunorubicin/doxorubicin resistance ATP-binding protein DrrA [Microgenomates bacterium OLB23]|nr:MAG: Daunorubicin/doxorubicin resistance ATP-binding protein DrrA [Microgenomates bacterium OLB23]